MSAIDSTAGFSKAPRSRRACRHETEISRSTIDWLVAAEQEPPLGAHVVTPRRGYAHHGIYVGEGRVVHYAGLAHGLCRGPVEEISLAEFTGGHGVYVRSDARTGFERWDVIRGARSRLGENCYRLLTDNCEHFCEWCLFGERGSFQVEAWLMKPRDTLAAMIRHTMRLLGLVEQVVSLSLPGGVNTGAEQD